MKKVTFLCVLIVLLISGCSEIDYSSEFKGLPIYPGTELILNNEFDNQVSEMYLGMYMNGDIEKVKKFFEKNIDSSIWTIEKISRPYTGHNVEKIYGYKLKSKDRNAEVTLAYSKSDKVGDSIMISITGDILK
jgi:hypothetical protein